MKKRKNMLNNVHIHKFLMDECDIKKISKKSKYFLSKTIPKSTISSDVSNISDDNIINKLYDVQYYKYRTRTIMDYLLLKIAARTESPVEIPEVTVLGSHIAKESKTLCRKQGWPSLDPDPKQL